LEFVASEAHVHGRNPECRPQGVHVLESFCDIAASRASFATFIVEHLNAYDLRSSRHAVRPSGGVSDVRAMPAVFTKVAWSCGAGAVLAHLTVRAFAELDAAVIQRGKARLADDLAA
jgi:hypothetical protein